MLPTRRPIQARSHRYMIKLAQYLAQRSCPTPNQISLLSVAFAALGALGLLSHHTLGMLLAALCIPLRLLCNLMDGMVAIEGGKKTALGDVFNEFPDRVADSLLLIAAGYACGAAALGWCAALLAAFTAYIRVFTGSLGLPQSFIGPMAKQQRMAVLTVCALIATWEMALYQSNSLMFYGLLLIVLGSAYTCHTRTRLLISHLQTQE